MSLVKDGVVVALGRGGVPPDLGRAAVLVGDFTWVPERRLSVTCHRLFLVAKN